MEEQPGRTISTVKRQVGKILSVDVLVCRWLSLPFIASSRRIGLSITKMIDASLLTAGTDRIRGSKRTRHRARDDATKQSNDESDRTLVYTHGSNGNEMRTQLDDIIDP